MKLLSKRQEILHGNFVLSIKIPFSFRYYSVFWMWQKQHSLWNLIRSLFNQNHWRIRRNVISTPITYNLYQYFRIKGALENSKDGWFVCRLFRTRYGCRFFSSTRYMEHNKSFKQLPPDDIMQNQFLSFLGAAGALFIPLLSISKD